MSELHHTYTTQSEAVTFCQTFNQYVSRGQVASWRRVGPGQYETWVTLA